MNTRVKRKVKRKRRKLRLFLFVFLLLIIGAGTYTYMVYNDVANAVDKMHNPLDRVVSEKREVQAQFANQDPLSILLVGVDEREDDRGRTDSMLVLTINPKLGSTKILSIPRDTRAELIDNDDPDNNWISKINHAYNGGIEMSIDTVEHFLNVPIDYYVQVSMEGFQDIVDAVGGIDVYNERSFELDGVYLEEGQHHLNGEEALAYARMRKEDPRGDFGRQERQREVISKVIDKGVSLSSLANYGDILKALEKNIKTNFTLDDMIDIQLKYKDAAKQLDKMEIEGEGEILNDGGWYFLVSDETRQNLSDDLRTHLELPHDEVDPSKASLR
ncbi:LCP family protein [Bacillus sp. 1P02SD]|uniref:LCP family glycopolymer transferase n=1 Tax=Bacillus sp. 1P02SD TaxID=3132264 RepID=UPI00399F1C58